MSRGRARHRDPAGVAARILVLIALTACGSAQKSPEPPNAAGAATLSASPSAAASTDAGPVGETIVTVDELKNPGPPLNLDPAAAPANAVTETIGPDGGVLTATAPDGTTYRLDIAPNVILFDTDITMTPLSDLNGLDLESQPEHRIGVQFEPAGLQFVEPATLSIRSASPIPDGEVAMVEFASDGSDAGLVTFDVRDGTATLAIDHFSGAGAFWPLHDEWWRIIARSKQRDLVRQIQAAIAAEMGLARAQQLRGTESDSILDIALKWAPIWDELVFKPLMEAANHGCREATDATIAYVAWDAQLQRMGLRDPETGEADPRLARPVPESLLILKRDLCFEEQFRRCRDTGDFEWLMAYFLSHFRQLELLGQDIPSDDVELAQLYLERCGRWDLDMTTREERPPNPEGLVEEFSYHVRIAWRPGYAVYGLVGSQASGEADATLEEVERTYPNCTYTISNFRAERPARVQIKHIVFDQFEDAPPKPRILEIEAFLGTETMDETHQCGRGQPETLPYRTDSIVVGEAMSGSFEGAFPLLVKKGWDFDDDPFSAEFTKDATKYTSEVHLEMTLTHTPAP